MDKMMIMYRTFNIMIIAILNTMEKDIVFRVNGVTLLGILAAEKESFCCY